MLVIAFTTNDQQVYHGFVCLFNFVQFSPGTNYVAGVLRTCLLWPKSVNLQQTIRTCEMFTRTENLSK